MPDNFTALNSKYPRCVDGRAAEVFLVWNDDSASWEVEKRGRVSKQENGPQFLGASLVFVKALEELASLERSTAFDLVEAASEELGFGLQVHLDDNYGSHHYPSMSDEDIVSLVSNHHTGCGFAAYAWGAELGQEVIQEAKARKWRLQLLVGEHAETGAIINYTDGQTFDTATAVEEKKARFNTDILPARRVFQKIEFLLEESGNEQAKGFAQKAEDWMLSTYKDVVVALKGVKAPEDIEVVE